MSPWFPNSIRRPSRWLATGALLALTPKCVVCLLAYAGLGAALGLGGPELCGGPAWSWPAASTLAPLACGALIGLGGFMSLQRKRPPSSAGRIDDPPPSPIAGE